MRVVFHNPHTNLVFGRTVLDFLIRNYSYKKYQYLLTYLIKNKVEFLIYNDKADSSLPSYLSVFIPSTIELYVWCIINNINPFKTNITSDISKIDTQDIFFSFSLKNLDTEYSGLDNISKARFLKVFHLTHFVQNTSRIAKNARKLNIDYFVAENNLSKNSNYFKKYFPFYKNIVYTLPFVYQKRFVNKRDFKSRKNKCIATGTLVNIKETGNPNDFKDFYNFYKIDFLQPERQKILKNKKKLSKYIDCYISNLYEKKLKRNNVGMVNRLWNKIHNAFISTKREYLKFNIVDKYNEYKMFINGEEINDLPGIGMVEGMACGAVYIGKRDSMYKDIGMIDKIHYIGYDGTIEDLVKKIKYYQKHEYKLELIAKNGTKFAKEMFNPDVAAKIFYSDLLKLSKMKKKHKKDNIVWKSSFTI